MSSRVELEARIADACNVAAEREADLRAMQRDEYRCDTCGMREGVQFFDDSPLCQYCRAARLKKWELEIAK